MVYQAISVDELLVNPANDRHGDMRSEAAAIAQLFLVHEDHMKKLAKDLVDLGEVIEPPLVIESAGRFVVADGNRRTTCLKLLRNPLMAPTFELQNYFRDLSKQWKGRPPDFVECRVETDAERVDEILYRRHTGVQGGIGQSTWTDRMKRNFVDRTGKKSRINVADEIEAELSRHDLLPDKPIPRSNMNRLLSNETLRSRVGITVSKGRLAYLCEEPKARLALQRIANDLALKEVTLDDLWNNDTKTRYLDRLEAEGALPLVGDFRAGDPGGKHNSPLDPLPESTEVSYLNSKRPLSLKEVNLAHRRVANKNLIPKLDFKIIWASHLVRHRAIFEELQHVLEVEKTPNAVSVLLRVLFEISIDNYIVQSKLGSVYANDSLAKKMTKVAVDLLESGSIVQSYLTVLNKLKSSDQIISIDTLHKYVHTCKLGVSDQHLRAFWQSVAPFVVLCLNAQSDRAT